MSKSENIERGGRVFTGRYLAHSVVRGPRSPGESIKVSTVSKFVSEPEDSEQIQASRWRRRDSQGAQQPRIMQRYVKFVAGRVYVNEARPLGLKCDENVEKDQMFVTTTNRDIEEYARDVNPSYPFDAPCGIIEPSSMPCCMGPQGPPGSTGPQGASGGPQGVQGAQGPRGYQGYTGVQGVQGVRGFQGDIGAQGIQGAQGAQGNQGVQGVQGNRGPQGFTGEQGSQGVQGNQGPIDLTGAVIIDPGYFTRNLIQPTSASYPALILRNAVSQTANILEVQTSSGAQTIQIAPSGTIASGAQVPLNLAVHGYQEVPGYQNGDVWLYAEGSSVFLNVAYDSRVHSVELTRVD